MDIPGDSLRPAYIVVARLTQDCATTRILALSPVGGLREDAGATTNPSATADLNNWRTPSGGPERREVNSCGFHNTCLRSSLQRSSPRRPERWRAFASPRSSGHRSHQRGGDARRPGRPPASVDRARLGRHNPTHRGRGQGARLDAELDRLRVDQRHGRTDRAPDRRSALPLAGIGRHLAGPRVLAALDHHGEPGLPAGTRGQRRRGRVPPHARSRRHRHLCGRAEDAQAAAALSLGAGRL